MVEWIEKYIERRLEEYNKELYLLEKKLSEYIGLKNEEKIKIEESYYKFLKKLKLIGFEHYGIGIIKPYRKQVIYINGETIYTNKIIMPELISDWDINSTSYELDTTDYISPPSSLKLVMSPSGRSIALCKYLGTTNIVQGRIVTWGKNTIYGELHFFFRNQSPVGTASYSTGYYLKIIYGTRNTRLYLDDNVVASTTSNYWWEIDWTHYRITWWNCPKGLCVRVEIESDGKWVIACDDLCDPSNKYVNSSINRVGIGGLNGHYSYTQIIKFDDTEIWSA